MRKLSNIFWLGTKELRSFMHDLVLLGLVVYAFSFAIIAQSNNNSQELSNASIAIVDEDHSVLSRRIAGAFLPPYFKPVRMIAERDIVMVSTVRKVRDREKKDHVYNITWFDVFRIDEQGLIAEHWDPSEMWVGGGPPGAEFFDEMFR